MRVFTYTWPFTFGVGLGWLCGVPNPDPRTARGRVYLLRGQGVVFSGGLGLLCRTLRREGFWAEDLRCVGDRWALAHLRAQLGRQEKTSPLVFVGHSCGGRYSLYAAHALHALGVAVDLLVCIDVAGPLPVPANVRRALNITRSRWRLYPAGMLTPAPGCLARIDNIDLDAQNSPVRARGLHHLNITDSPGVQELVLKAIRQVAD